MTPEEHNKYLGIAHLAYAGIQILMLVVMIAFMGVILSDIYGKAQSMGGDPPPAFLGLVVVFVGLFQLVLSVPPIVAGYAFLKRRPWAKIAGIVAGVVTAMNVPIGAAVSAYTFWFLFSNVGKQLYDKNAVVLPPAPPAPPASWQSISSDRSQDLDHGRPFSTPDWR